MTLFWWPQLLQKTEIEKDKENPELVVPEDEAIRPQVLAPDDNAGRPHVLALEEEAGRPGG